jgi:alkaline phosphatase
MFRMMEGTMKKSYELKSFSIRLAFSLLLSLTAFISFSGFEPSDVVYDKCKDQEMYHADCSRFIAKEAGQAKNVILLIGDGMGIPQTWLVRTYLNGPAKHLVWEDLPNQGLMTTCSIGHITDSAASGTALATGYKTTNGRISISASGSETLPNILDRIHDRKAVGVVSTGSMVDATPAVFVSHVTLRSMEDSRTDGQ